MDLISLIRVNLKGCVGSSASAAENVKKQKTPVVPDSGRRLVPSAEFASFPAVVSHLVGDYVSDSDKEDVETAFAGVQPITLCLSQDVGSKLASCWSIGFLPPDRQWKPSDVKIDKEYLIQDYKGCLQLLEQEDSNYCRVAIEVLVVKLSNTSNDFPSTLNALQKTIKKLQRHLSGVKHVVFSIHEHVSCCFTLSDPVGKVDKARQSVDKSIAIFEIINDLHTCWSDGNTLDARQLFAFYFKSGVERTSERYLAKFVIPLNCNPNRKLFDDEASKMLSTKIMWVCSLKSIDDFIHVDQNTSRLCHAFYFDLSDVEKNDVRRLRDRLEDILCFQDNRFIERIVIVSHEYGHTVQLPRPSAPLNAATPLSALIELTLTLEFNTFDLNQLNNGYFPNLTHLSIIGGKAHIFDISPSVPSTLHGGYFPLLRRPPVIGGAMTGRLDSHRVPLLTTLILEPRMKNSKSFSEEMKSLIRDHPQALLRCGRPWQLVATQFSGGWSLASYDEPISNPQDDGKEDAPPSPPFIRELMLVMETKEHTDEFQSRLNGDPPLKAAQGHQNEGLLVWAPDRVEKITAFCTLMYGPQLEFKKEIPGKTRILRSLMCHNVKAAMDGVALPNLQSLEMNHGDATLSGSFSQLKKLSFNDTAIVSPWEVNAPLLESLICQGLKDGNMLSLRPELLPCLSYLRIELDASISTDTPKIIVDKGGPGLSRVQHVVFGRGMTDTPYFDQCQVQNVSHFELTVEPMEVPVCWDMTEWLCDELTIHFYEYIPEFVRLRELNSANTPLLMPKVKKLTVTEEGCRVLLDSVIPELTDLTVPSPESLGPNLKCPSLKRICFTGQLSLVEKEKGLNHATYEAIDALPSVKWVYFERDGEAKSMF